MFSGYMFLLMFFCLAFCRIKNFYFVIFSSGIWLTFHHILIVNPPNEGSVPFLDLRMACVTLHPTNLSLWFQLKMRFYPFENTGALQPEVRFPAPGPALLLMGSVGRRPCCGFCVGK